jgi:TP901-1 family phage major tail protein
MAAKQGLLWALSVDTTPGATATYSAIAGLRTRSFKVNNTNIDVTTASSTAVTAGQGQIWRDLLDQTGVLNIEIDAAGLYQQDANTHTLLTLSTTGAARRMQLVANGVTLIGTFIVDSYEANAAYNEAHQFTVKLISSGAITISTTNA